MGKIGVVGSINMDMTVKTERIPLKGETLKGEDLKYIPGGKGANQAVAAARLGADVEMFGCVGDDSAGESLVKNLQEQGVKTKHIRTVPGVPAGLAMILALAIGTFLGAVSGILVTKGRLQPFIATLITMTVYRGVTMIFTGAKPISNLGDSFY